MKDAIFFLLGAFIFTLLIVIDMVNGVAELHSTRTQIYLAILCFMYVAAFVAGVRVFMFKSVQKKMARKWGQWRSNDE